MKKLSSKQEGSIAVLAAIVVLFSAMLDPLVSVALAVCALFLLGVYRLVSK